jgi:hypothetical protein
MLRLSTDREPFWLDLALGVRARFRPVTIAMILVARAAAAAAFKPDDDDAQVLASVAFTRSIAHAGLIEWEGVGDANGKPVEPLPDAIDALLEHWQLFDAIDRLYVGPALIGADEKNASSPLPSGISAGAKGTARHARKSVKAART